MIPYLDLKPQYKALQKDIDQSIQNVLEHGQFILGPEVAECEKALAAYIGTQFCLTAASGTDALMIALMALDIGPGDEVITTPFSFFATAEVISLVGATPVFIDIDLETYTLDAKQIKNAITANTKAIMPVSLYGQPADFDEITAVADQHGLTVIEDSAQSFGAPYNGSRVKGRSSGLSRVGGTSFFPAKPLGCYGDGGAVFTNDAELNHKMEQVRVHGQQGRYNHVRMGINGRLDTLQCAVLIEKLKRYDWELTKRNEIAARYTSELGALKGVTVPKIKSDRGSVWAQYTLLVEDRVAFAEALKELGVPTSVHYPSPLHHQPIYSNLRAQYEGRLPKAEYAAAHCISLPLYPDMSLTDQTKVIESVTQVLKGLS